ncbi:MAG TPA: DNA repair and recombination protein RadA [Nitrososphaeraceae archaeon]|nr:DNA repair and recombination protein RadA [Nitrososphaeraceae archaeon]
MSDNGNDEIFDIDILNDIGPATKSSLKEAGFRSIKDLVIRGPMDIAEATGIAVEKCTFLCNRARELLEDIGVFDKPFITANQLYEKRKSEYRITTGSKNLDELLGGGIETRAITELYGEFGTGKSQICHTLCLTVQETEDEHNISRALYVDTENTFRPERIASIASARKIDPTRALENVIVAKAYNSSHQEVIIQESANIINLHNIKIMIVDSIVSHYRAEFLGRSFLSERQQRINRLLHILLRIAETCKIAVVITNQIQSSPDAIFGDSNKATGGNVMAHTSTYRIYLKKAGKNRIARMVDSPYHSEREVLFTINEQGVGDPQK